MAKTFTDFTPKEIVAELDKYIIGQDKAKRSVAVALRNREGLQSAILEEGQEGGNGRFTNLMIWGKDSSEKKAYLNHVAPDSILE